MASNVFVSKLGGYDYSFIDPPPDDLVCQICLLVALDPQQLTCCGKVYCKVCLEGLTDNTCPNCRGNTLGLQFPDTKSSQHVKALKVHCKNSSEDSEGCDWTGELGNMDQHLATDCGLAFMDCANKCTDLEEKVVQILRKNEKLHLTTECPNRIVECEVCDEEGPHCFIMGPDHQDVCPLAIIECPNGCSEQMERQDLDNHYDDCPDEPIECPYEDIGCYLELPRREMPAHENETALHLKLAIKEIQVLKLANKEIQALKIKPLIDNRLTFKISDFDPQKSIYGPPFFTSPGGYKMCLRISSKDYYMGVYLYLMRGENDDTLPWPFGPAMIQITLLNQEENKRHHLCTVNYPTERDNKGNERDAKANRRVTIGETANFGYGTGKFTPLASLKEPYLMKGILYFRITILNVPEPRPWLVCN